jgi:hypothetical protein
MTYRTHSVAIRYCEILEIVSSIEKLTDGERRGDRQDN